MFKILNGYENIDSNIFFEIKESKTTRGHNYMLVMKQSRLDVRKYSFSLRTINVWNKLSTDNLLVVLIIIIIIMFLIRTVVHQDTFNATYMKRKEKFVQKRIQHGEWYNTTANCMLTDILSRMENAPSQPPPQPIHIARPRTTMPATPETNRATRPTMHAKHNR